MSCINVIFLLYFVTSCPPYLVADDNRCISCLVTPLANRTFCCKHTVCVGGLKRELSTNTNRLTVASCY